MRKVLVVALVLCLALFALLWLAPETVAPITPNPLAATRDSVLERDPRNRGVAVDVRYAGLMDRKHLIIDLLDIGPGNSRLDVFRVLLQLADALKSSRFESVDLRFRGEPRFRLDGRYFQELGADYETQHVVYTARKFPSHVKTPGGAAAYGEWTGGLLGVATKEMEDFADFHDRWYLRSLLGR